MERQIFRAAAIETISLPDQLDDAITVTSPMSWIALTGAILVFMAFSIWSFTGIIPTSVGGTAIMVRDGGNQAVTVAYSGQLVDFKITAGEIVAPGQTIGHIRQYAPDYVPYLQQPVTSHCGGRVLEVMANSGDVLQAGTALITVEPINAQLQAVIFMPLADAKKVKVQMAVRLSPSNARQDEYGFLRGIVRTTGDFSATQGGMMHFLNNDNLVESLRSQGPVVMIVVDLVPDPSTPTGYKWSTSHGPPGAIVRGTICSARVTVQEDRPIHLIIPRLRSLTGL